MPRKALDIKKALGHQIREPLALSMTPQKWTVSALAAELKVDRRRLTEALKDVEPCGVKGRATYYWMRDAVRAVFAPKELDVQQETARLRRIQTEKTEIQVARERGDLIDAKTAERVWTDQAMAMRAKMMSLPSALAPQVVGLSVVDAQSMMEKAVGDALTELKDYDAGDYMPGAVGDVEGDGEDAAAPAPKRKRVGRPRKGTQQRGKRGAGAVAD